MRALTRLSTAFVVSAVFAPSLAGAEILAMMNYETKSAESLKVLKHPVAPQDRKEGIAIIDVDPASASYGKVIKEIALPSDLIAHHIFYNRDSSKAYVTALGKGELRVIDMSDEAMPMKTVAVPDCQVGEDVVFSEDNATWYLTCMGSHKIIMGNARTDQLVKTIDVPNYPHGIAVHNGIDRILVTSTVRATDLGDPGDKITAVEASTGKVLGSYTVSKKPSPAGEAPVEILFVPGANPPVAYVTNMYGGSLWTARWDPEKKDFTVAEAFDFGPLSVGVPLEMYFNPTVDRLYVTTAKPGHFHIFDISQNAAQPKLIKTLPAAEGAHHVAFTKNWHYAFVQNALLNLPGMSDGAITVIDLQTEKVVGSMDTLKEQGFNPNCIVLLPRWNDLAGH
jgi:DNA-binding beta-propeller fold protein YncE